jgi:exonuclease SbcC
MVLPIQDLGNAKVVAIVGDNGAGKTTAMGLVPAAIYQEIPSRGRLAAMATSRSSEVEVELETDQRYRLKILIDGLAKPPKSEGYLFDAEGKPLVNGKIRQLEAEVAKRFPDYGIFLSSVFSAQNKEGNFLELDPAPRKQLFAKMLGLGRLETLSESAKQHGNLSDQTIIGLRARQSEIERQAGEAEKTRSDLLGTKELLDVADRSLSEAEQESKLSADLMAAWQTECERLKRAVDSAQSESKLTAERLDGETKALALLRQRLAQVGARRASLEQRLTDRDRLVVDAARSPKRAVEKIDNEIEELRKLEADYNTKVIEWTHHHSLAVEALNNAKSEYNREVAAAKADLRMVEEKFNNATGLAAGTKLVPCHAEGPYTACPLITSGVAAKNSLASLQERLTISRDRLTEAEKNLRPVESASAAIADLGDKPLPPDTSERQADLEHERQEAREVITLASKAAEALAALNVAKEQAGQLDVEALEIRKEAEKTDARCLLFSADAERASAAAVSEQKQLAAHTTIRPPQHDPTRLERCRKGRADAAISVARLEGMLGAAENAMAELEKIKPEVELAISEVDDWRHLQRALGRDGVQALEVDAAGPEVSTLTNDLLHACYGSRFSVALETTAERADGSGTRETFDLRVVDAEGGVDGSVDKLSGGQKVIISEALSIAIAIYNCQRSDQPMQTLWRDECSGALSSANAHRYVQMLRRACEVGGFDRVFFVAHQPSLWALADAQIIFENGGCHLVGINPVVTETPVVDQKPKKRRIKKSKTIENGQQDESIK